MKEYQVWVSRSSLSNSLFLSEHLSQHKKYLLENNYYLLSKFFAPTWDEAKTIKDIAINKEAGNRGRN